jgi:hypothetical protein
VRTGDTPAWAEVAARVIGGLATMALVLLVAAAAAAAISRIA